MAFSLSLTEEFMYFYFFLSIIVYPPINEKMENCFEVKSQKELYFLLKKEGIDISTHATPLPGDRYSPFFSLKDGRIVIVANVNIDNCNGLLLENKKCLDEMIRNDYIPLENPEQDFLESDQIGLTQEGEIFIYFRDYLNFRFNLNHIEVDINSYKDYYVKILSAIKNDSIQHKDGLALLIIAGEILRKKHNARWLLLQRTGMYNPYFEPTVLLDNEQFIELPFYVLNRLTNGLSFDQFYFNNLLNAIPSGDLNNLRVENRRFIIRDQ